MVSKPVVANVFINPMATATNTSFSSTVFNLLAQVIFIKLDGTNFLAWSAQLIPPFRSYDHMGIINDSEPSPPQFSRGPR